MMPLAARVNIIGNTTHEILKELGPRQENNQVFVIDSMRMKKINLYFAFCCLPSLLAIGCSRDPKVRRARFIDSGQKYMVKSEYEAASIQFRRAAQVDPTSAEAHYDLALSLGKLGRWQESYRELQATTQIDPRNVPGHLATAEMLAGMKQFDAARREIDLVLQIEPDNYDAHLLAGNTWLAQQQYKSALEEFDTCQRLKPDKGIGFVQAGAVYLRRGTYDDAVRVLNQAIEADAAFVPGYVYLAEAHRLQNNPEAEIAALLN